MFAANYMELYGISMMNITKITFFGAIKEKKWRQNKLVALLITISQIFRPHTFRTINI